MAKQTFLQGTLILILAGMITRFLGFLNRIVVARLMGEEGVGLYMMALPTLFLVMTLANLGLPVAISKRVAEAEARDDQKKVKQILSISLLLTTLSSILFTFLLIGVSPFVANTLMTDDRTLYPLLAISPILPIVSISSVIKGYFQGKQNMKPQSVALVIEQVVRISSVSILIVILLPFGVEYAATGAMISVVLGELMSLLYMIFLFKRKKTFKIRRRFLSYIKSSKQTIRELFSISLPNTGSRMIGSVSHFLEPILVSQSLLIAGVSSTMATKQYGELTGYVLPLLFLPTFITNSLSITIVPSISEAEANNNRQLIHYRIHQSIRISFASGAIATIVLTLFSHQLLTYMYGTAHASHFLILMAPFFLLLYIQAPLQAALQALDLARPAMWNSLIGAICKFTALIALTTRSEFGINGVAIAMIVGVIIVTFLHLKSLKRNIRFSMPIKDITKMSVLMIMTGTIGFILKTLYEAVKPNIFIFACVLLLFLLIYIFFIFILRFITKEELKQIPWLEKWFA